MRKYYSLLIREDGRWTMQFGGYVKAVVMQERRDSYGSVKGKDWCVVCTGDRQEEIVAKVKKLNQ